MTAFSLKYRRAFWDIRNTVSSASVDPNAQIANSLPPSAARGDASLKVDSVQPAISGHSRGSHKASDPREAKPLATWGAQTRYAPKRNLLWYETPQTDTEWAGRGLRIFRVLRPQSAAPAPDRASEVVFHASSTGAEAELFVISQSSEVQLRRSWGFSLKDINQIRNLIRRLIL